MSQDKKFDLGKITFSQLCDDSSVLNAEKVREVFSNRDTAFQGLSDEIIAALFADSSIRKLVFTEFREIYGRTFACGPFKADGFAEIEAWDEFVFILSYGRYSLVEPELATKALNSKECLAFLENDPTGLVTLLSSTSIASDYQSITTKQLINQTTNSEINNRHQAIPGDRGEIYINNAKRFTQSDWFYRPSPSATKIILLNDSLIKAIANSPEALDFARESFSDKDNHYVTSDFGKVLWDRINSFISSDKQRAKPSPTPLETSLALS